MESVDYLIIGGGIAGTVAAETARKHDQGARIVIITAEAERLYSRVMLVRYLQGSVERERLFLRQAQDYERQNIEINFQETVESLDANAHVVTTTSGRMIQYKKLVIATGGRASVLDVPGSALAGIYPFKTIEDADAIREFAARSKQVVVVGGGFVALELIDTLATASTNVTVLLREQGFFNSLVGDVGSRIIADQLANRGITLKTGVTVETFAGEASVTGVQLNTDETLPTDLVALGIGQTYLQSWMEIAGLETAAKAIKTNEYLETTVPDVFAAGDVAAFYDPAVGHNHRLGSWLNAQLQGMAVGASIAGVRTAIHSTSFYRADFSGQSTVFIGDLNASDRKIVDKIISSTSIERYWLEGEILMGAVLVNRPERIKEIQQLIGKRFTPVVQ